MRDGSYDRAPHWRRTAAGLVDAAVFGGLWWLVGRRELVRNDRLIARLFAVPHELLREQLRTPGQLLLGTRTVDKRTGARVALSRTLALALVGAAGQELTRRLTVTRTPEQEREREAFAEEMHAIMERHPQASPERDAAHRELFARHPQGTVSVSLLRATAPALLVGLLNNRLKHRLAPTVEILARRG